MSTSAMPDPFQFWRDAMTKLEGNVNTMAAGSMESKELMGSLHQLSAVSLGLQQAFEKALGAYFAKINLPSRKDITELAATLQRVEDKLDRLLPAAASAPSPRPARTRRPPEAAAQPALHAPPAPSASPAPARRTAKTARRRS